jgi:hypothetical protein
MKHLLLACVFAAISMIGFAGLAYSHHSPAAYDIRQTITVTGTVTRLNWFNPHVYVYVEQVLDSGDKIEWQIEAFPPAMLRRIGWRRDTVRIGDTLTVQGNPTRNAANRGLFPSSIQHGEKKLFALRDAFATPQSTRQTTGIEGTWATAITAVATVVSPPLSQLTAEGIAARKRYVEAAAPTSHCIPTPPPWWMVTPDLRRVTATKDAVIIESELGLRRTVHMNLTTHEGATPSIQGHSIGRWEGKTLVIETTHFAYHGIGNGGGNGISLGVPSSPQKKLIERLTPNADGVGLTYSFEVTDPQFLAAPTKRQVVWTFSPASRFEIEPCDLDAARRFIKD